MLNWISIGHMIQFNSSIQYKSTTLGVHDEPIQFEDSLWFNWATASMRRPASAARTKASVFAGTRLRKSGAIELNWKMQIYIYKRDTWKVNDIYIYLYKI